ncbi:MAG: spermidine/putrescine ABC transporter substrate-binding protein [bacterium]|nr:spermidine/putrescine ABC transporter substrate-binding protein [bacterium]
MRLIQITVWLLCSIPLIAGCTSQTGSTLIPTISTQRELAIYNWGTYIAPELLTKFETQYHVTIRYDEFDNDDALLKELREGTSYDIVVPTDTLLPLMRNEGLLAPLNHANIPNLANLAPEFSNPSYDPQNRYSVPYQWGTIGIAYNIANTGRELTSWYDLFDPAFAGRVGILDDYNVALGAILLMLGYSPNSLNVVHIEEARDFLMPYTEQLVIIGDVGQDYLVSGELDVVMEFNGDIAQLMRDNPDIRFVIPEEGGYIFIDVLAIPKTSRNKDLAEMFINFILDPQNGAILSNEIRYGSPNLASRPFLNQDDLTDPIIYPPADVQKRLFYQGYIDAQTNALYAEFWEAFRQINRPLLSVQDE